MTTYRCPPFALHTYGPWRKRWHGELRGLVQLRECERCGHEIFKRGGRGWRVVVDRGQYVPHKEGRDA